ncbi:MAG: site-2 protease family protein [Paracoccaceae bacterium]|nr:site-2 protease family protein [Paracoccaceae bacterium]
MFNDTPIFEFRGPWGVPVQIGSSLVLLALIFISVTGSPQEVYYDAIFFGLIVGSIFLHELGHAWGCLIQGVPVRRVMIYGGGGFCEHARSTSPREDELIVAMGPIVNAVLWAVSSLLLPFAPDGDITWILGSLAWINGVLLVLNLVPVMPLDGGKLFHLLLLWVMPGALAMRVAGAVGLVLSVLWIPAMLACFLFYGMMLLFIPPIGLHWRMLRGAQMA